MILEPADKETYNIKLTLEQLFDKFNAYKNFKKTINSSSFPMVPFIPIISSDILKIDALYETSTLKQDNGEISLNITKMDMLFQSYESLYLSRFSSYDFEPIKIIQDFLGRYYREVLFCYTETQDVLEIEEILHFNIMKQMKEKQEKSHKK